MSKLLIIIIILSVSACGGGSQQVYSSSDSPNSVPVFVNNKNDNESPIISGPNETIVTNEGSLTVTTVSALDPNHDVPLNYKLEGNGTSSSDYTSFDISSTGVITYKTSPVYITKNAYSFTVAVSDQFTSTKKDVSVVVK
ncbi:MAG: hypothetical protein OSB24_04860, partial [Woeseiaceae bacterium]|nr:hypothetical protein [Woeseiaceae bacterium]